MEEGALGPHEGDGAVPASSSGGGRASASSGGGAASSAAPPPGSAVEVPNPEDVRDSDLLFFQSFVRYERQSPPTEKIKGIADAIHGKVELHKMIDEVSGGFMAVVMKRMDNQRVDSCAQLPRSDRTESADTEDALTEIGTYTYLSSRGRCDSVLRLLGCFRDARYTWLATEHCEAELFNVVAMSATRMGEDRVRLFVSQLLEAVAHLHRNNVGHRDISLENILLKGRSQLKLIDFGQAVLCRTRDGRRFRYFRVCGKHYYRAPEVYRPHGQFEVEVQRPDGVTGDVVQVHPSDADGYLYQVRLPEGTVGMRCRAELAGYEVEPLDMFAIGVCMFILHCRNPPWKNAVMFDKGFKFIALRGVESLLQAWGIPLLSPHGMALLGNLLRVNPARRCDLTHALQSEWLAAAAEPADPGGGAEDGAESGGAGGASAPAAGRPADGSSASVDAVAEAMAAATVSGVPASAPCGSGASTNGSSGGGLAAASSSGGAVADTSHAGSE